MTGSKVGLKQRVKVGLAARDSGDFKAAFEAFSACADLGSIEAEAELGVLYFTGLGVARDLT